MSDALYLIGAAALLAIGLPLALFGVWYLFARCAPTTYLIRDGALLRPDGRAISEYDGNDPKHFPPFQS